MDLYIPTCLLDFYIGVGKLAFLELPGLRKAVNPEADSGLSRRFNDLGWDSPAFLVNAVCVILVLIFLLPLIPINWLRRKNVKNQNVVEIRTEIDNISKGIPTVETATPQKSPKTSKEITLTFRWNKILVPALVLIAVVVAGLIIWSPWTQKAPTTLTTDNPSVIILPFDDLSSSQDQATFCIGMMDEIRDKLSNVQVLKVISRTPAMKYKELSLDATEIGEKLNVEYVLEGSVRKEGDDIRVYASLISASDMSSVWSSTFNKRIEGVFEIQSEIAQEIAKALKASLSPEDMEQLKEKPTENLMAYEYYIQGRSLFYTYDRENNEQAIIQFEKALELDPSFSLAFSGLSKCYTIFVNHGWDYEEKWLIEAEIVAKKAIELNDQSAEAHFALGYINETRKEYDDMEREMRKVLSLNPNHAHAHDGLGDVLHRWHGNLEEALLELNTALTLDPYLWGSYWNIADIYMKQGKYSDSEQILQRALEIDKDKDWTLGLLGKSYYFM